MPSAVKTVRIDNTVFATGSHDGANASATLRDMAANFKSCGVTVGRLIKNTTDGSEGAIEAVTENEITVTLSGGSDNLWDKGDVYEIYFTATENGLISTMWVDRRYGRKITAKDKLVAGYFPDDMDEDEFERRTR